MMKKRYLKLSIFTMAMMFVLSGCGSDFPDLTADEQQVIGEYAATLLMKYDANNRSRLMSREEVEAAELKMEELEQARQELTGEWKDPVEDTPVIEIGQGGSSVSGGDITQVKAFWDCPRELHFPIWARRFATAILRTVKWTASLLWMLQKVGSF